MSNEPRNVNTYINSLDLILQEATKAMPISQKA